MWLDVCMTVNTGTSAASLDASLHDSNTANLKGCRCHGIDFVTQCTICMCAGKAAYGTGCGCLRKPAHQEVNCSLTGYQHSSATAV
jgi:hypothetical protein